MMKSLVLTLVFGFVTAFGCSFVGTRSMQYDTLEPGVVRVIYSFPQYNMVTKKDEQVFDTSFSRIRDFKIHMNDILAENALVFIGVVDSVIGQESDTLPQVPVADITLDTGRIGDVSFLARIKVDTLFKGTVPSQHFWIRGATASGAGCGIHFGTNLGARFLNFSDQLKSMQDLKLPQWINDCWTCPRQGYFLSNDRLYSPEFPGIGLMRSELFSGDVSALQPKRFKAPSQASGRAYFPDGRAAPSSGEASRHPTPALLVR